MTRHDELCHMAPDLTPQPPLLEGEGEPEPESDVTQRRSRWIVISRGMMNFNFLVRTNAHTARAHARICTVLRGGVTVARPEGLVILSSIA